MAGSLLLTCCKMGTKMKNDPHHHLKNQQIDQTISDRAGLGPNEMIKGWQSILIRLLNQLGSHLQPSRIVSFRTLTADEQQMFERIIDQVCIDSDACGVYLSPSVRNQMMYTNRGKEIPDEAKTPTDDGVLLFSRLSSHDTIINALLAHPPHAAAVDVYQDGALIAGYVFNDIDDCLAGIADVVTTYLGRH